jgi:nitrogenase subunit NifH
VNSSNYTKLKFIEGITDLRARVTGGDSLPTTQRIGIQFNTDNVNFMNNIVKMLENDFSENFADKINVNKGATRNRDNVLRIIPSSNTHRFFRNAFHKLISNEMARINNKI